MKIVAKAPAMDCIQYTGDNLLDVIAFTGKHPRFSEWFESDEAYVNYVKNDQMVFKLIKDGGNQKVYPGDYVARIGQYSWAIEQGQFKAQYLIVPEE